MMVYNMFAVFLNYVLSPDVKSTIIRIYFPQAEIVPQKEMLASAWVRLALIPSPPHGHVSTVSRGKHANVVDTTNGLFSSVLE